MGNQESKSPRYSSMTNLIEYLPLVRPVNGAQIVYSRQKRGKDIMIENKKHLKEHNLDLQLTPEIHEGVRSPLERAMFRVQIFENDSEAQARYGMAQDNQDVCLSDSFDVEELYEKNAARCLVLNVRLKGTTRAT
jgi:hypothetical protein